MKFHGMLLSALLCALLLLTAACGNGKVPPTPTAKPNTTAKPSPTLAPTPAASPSPSANASGTDDPNTVGDALDTIEGFVEGAVVELAELPEKVMNAIRDKYPDATVKGASYATYMNGQMYKLTLEGAKDGTTDLYARADGTLVPYSPDATPTPSAGGAGGSTAGK